MPPSFPHVKANCILLPEKIKGTEHSFHSLWHPHENFPAHQFIHALWAQVHNSYYLCQHTLMLPIIITSSPHSSCLKAGGGQNTIHFAELSDRPPNLRMIIKPKWVNPAFRLSSHTLKTTLDHWRDHKEQQLILGCTLLCICQSCTSYSHSRKRCYFLSSFIFKQSKPWKGLHVGRFMQWDCYQK